MSSKLTLKYTSIDIETDDADPGVDYYGYMAVQFNYSTETERFFMDSYEMVILNKVTEFMNKLVGGYTKEEIRIEDVSLLIDLKKTEHKKFGPDIAKIVRDVEKDFDEKVGA